MAIRSPAAFVQLYNGKTIDYDKVYGVQCVDGFKVGCTYLGVPVVACPNNLAESYWTCKDGNGNVVKSVKDWQTKHFDLIADSKKFRDGDWVVWPRGSVSHPSSHVALYYRGQEFGQRQYEDARGFCLKNTDFSDAAGALRWKGWRRFADYESDITINGHLYHLYGQAAGLRPVIISPGLHKVARIRDMDVPFDVFGKITGCNYFQNDPDNKAGRPFGETYGDISSPLCGVYQNLPNQDSTMFFDLETGAFGDCTDVSIDPGHNVFSPALIYPRGQNVQYARMVGLGHTTLKNTYTFIMRFDDGTYVMGLADSILSPNEIVDDIRSVSDPESVSFLDGGGSAQMMRYITAERRVEYTLETIRATAGCIAFVGAPAVEQPAEPPQAAELPAEPDETEKDEEETIVEQQTTAEKPEMSQIDGWKDPEPQTNVILERIASLMSVKSLLTLTLTAVFAYLVINKIDVPEFFSEIYKVVILFFFGYQTGKAQQK